MNIVKRLAIPFFSKNQFPLAFLNTNFPTHGIVLAADVGGTKTNLALFKITDTNLETIDEQSFQTNDYDSFIDLFHTFYVDKPNNIDVICLSVAGPVISNVAQGTNFPWIIDGEKISEKLKVKSVFVINDLVANAYGLAALHENDFETLITGENLTGNAAIISPGTGLGEAGLFWDGEQYHPFGTEGGHCSFSPQERLDFELYSFLHQKYGDVSWERILSGQGIIDLHDFLRQFRNSPMPHWFIKEFIKGNPAVLITKAAIEKKDTICIETLDMFLRFLATEASQIALKLKATGGIYIGGGIIPKIIKGIDKKIFTNNFVQSGRMAPLLEMMPVKVILNEKTPLLGAALYGIRGIG